ncbi:MAG: hypothetical protein ACRYG7_13135 [Janthinobacterium lividum]
MSKKLTQAEFLAKAVAVHGVGRYGYSQAVYCGRLSKLTIVCPQHGAFTQAPAGHIRGSGCPACGDERTRLGISNSLETFVEKARAVHGETYDYAGVVYINCKTKIVISCPQHGAFTQAPNDHISQKAGCPKCKANKVSARSKGTLETFLDRARAVHGSRYDYSHVAYAGHSAKVAICCPAHGLFTQSAGSHLQGTGCPRCGCEKISDLVADSLETFVEKARAVHGETYDYSRSNFSRAQAKVVILCSQHGPFTQARASHIGGQGCPVCGRQKLTDGARLSWVERANGRLAVLYMLRIFNDTEQFYKVGVTLHTVKWRYRASAALANYSYEIVAQHHSYNAVRVHEWEQSILETFADLRYKPRQRFGGDTECFSSADEILAIFPL